MFVAWLWASYSAKDNLLTCLGALKSSKTVGQLITMSNILLRENQPKQNARWFYVSLFLAKCYKFSKLASNENKADYNAVVQIIAVSLSIIKRIGEYIG